MTTLALLSMTIAEFANGRRTEYTGFGPSYTRSYRKLDNGPVFIVQVGLGDLGSNSLSGLRSAWCSISISTVTVKLLCWFCVNSGVNRARIGAAASVSISIRVSCPLSIHRTGTGHLCSRTNNRELKGARR